MNISNELLANIKEYVLSEYPKEACGLIVGNEFIPMENISENPENSFKIDPVKYARYMEEVTCIIHSHIIANDRSYVLDPRMPSINDRKNQKISNKQWGILATEGENVTDILFYPHIPNNTYVGRRFIPYVSDCYTIVQDYYKFELGITAPEYPKDYTWHDKMGKKILEPFLNFPGVIEITNFSKLKNGDVLVLNHRAGETSHFGIYHNGYIIHQDIISAEVPFSHFIGDIVKILRYEASNES